MKCVIVGAAEIKNYERCKRYFSAEEDFFVFCDGGLKHRKKLGVNPNLIVGDFDSCEIDLQKDFPSVEKISLPREKDDTDLFFAAKETLKRGFSDFLILGAIGGRFDHSLVNISVLLYLFNQGKPAKIVDDFSEMQIVGKTPVFVEDDFPYFSVIAIGGKASGVNEKNAKFPLENATIEPDFQYGISNEVLPGKKAEISAENGVLLLVKDF